MPTAPACPDCGAATKLRRGPWGLFYGCVRYPECKGLQKANQHGEPVGIPATLETRKLRAEVIRALKDGILDRGEVTKAISQMTAEDCEAALRHVDHGAPPYTIWEMLDEQRAFDEFYSKP